MDALIAEFTSITGAPPRKAESYLRVSDNNLAQAIQLFFETGGVDMEDPPSPARPAARPAAAAPAPASRPTGVNSEPIEIGDDGDDDDLLEALMASGGDTSGVATGGADVGSSAFDDEALARQIQEELYGEVGGDSNGVRAPIARTRETLVDDDDYGYPDPMRHMSRVRGRGTFLFYYYKLNLCFEANSDFPVLRDCTWDLQPTGRERLGREWSFFRGKPP